MSRATVNDPGTDKTEVLPGPAYFRYAVAGSGADA